MRVCGRGHRADFWICPRIHAIRSCVQHLERPSKMNQKKGLFGKKLGCTQIFQEDGNVARVTVIDVSECRVVGKRTEEKDGYSALVFGYGERKDKHVNKPEAGVAKKTGQKTAKEVREFRMPSDLVALFDVGASPKPSELFAIGDFVDVCGFTKGRGFTGVMKRWNFKGSKNATHGTHEYQRHGGAIGTNMTPGRTLKNLKMPGQYGSERVTVQNLRVAKVIDDQGLVLVEGGVPGSRNGYVTVREAIKKNKKN